MWFGLSRCAYAQLTTVGKEFWVGFMENNTDGLNGRAVIVISANESAQGTIDLSNFLNGLTYHFDLQKGENYTMRITEYDLDLLHRTSGVIENGGINITSTGNISVYAFNERWKSADGTVILPKRTLGKDYLVTSHYEVTPNNIPGQDMNQNDESLFLIVGVEDNTRIEITPSANTIDGKTAGMSFEITLNSGQSYQLKSKSDLTGSRVRVIGSSLEDCKNIAVFGGNKWTGVGECGSAPDNLYQQMYPLKTWGKSYIHVPFETRSSGELIKVLAAEDNTLVNIDDDIAETLNKGEWKAFDFGPDKVVTINANHPISVTAFSKSRNCNTGGDPYSAFGDPFMMTYNPNERLLEDITFEAMNVVQISYHFVNVVVKKDAVNQTILDGNNIASAFQPVPGNTEFFYAKINISGGVHHLKNPQGFIAYAYGFGDLESYGYAVGANLENLQFETASHYDDFEVIGDNVTCLGNEFSWTVTASDPRFDHFTWYIGDDDNGIEGDSIRYLFEEPGNYWVTILASDGEIICNELEEIRFEVEVLETKAVIEGPSVVCPADNQARYHLLETDNISKIDWLVTGGEIIESDLTSATVLWNASSDSCVLSVIPYTIEGCPGNPILKEVDFLLMTHPNPPLGPTEICFDQEVSHFYEVNEHDDTYGYQWHIEGGEFVSSSDAKQIEVRWNTPESQGKLWYEEFSLENPNCIVTSEKLEVNIRGDFSARYLSENVKCNGASSGKITINPIGGMAPYNYTWSHDSRLNGPEAVGLEAGNYSVEVIDSLGCKTFVNNIQIEEPEKLNAIIWSNSGTSCYGNEDGEVVLKVSGGTPPFHTDFPNASVDGEEVQLTNLAAGSQDLEIYDAFGCVLSYELNVPQPEPLTVEVEVLQRSCPGESTGELLAVPSGGTLPYQFTWDYQSVITSNLAGIPKGNYMVTVQDANGCISFGNTMLVEKEPQVRMPTGFDPNDKADIKLFGPVSNCPIDFFLTIYSKWGEPIYAGSEGWDGIIKGKSALPNSYSYLLEYSYTIDGKSYQVQKRGVFTIID
ncbi:hypothetical protein [Echinicola sp. 20G]|uniref:hypothetical protein n=1 Tax=Echinicola sp. 20G TaxID=2781961 RepID=UPI0019111063|nr:hypothetical protein [Echinicola sp. 20G]